MSKDHMTKVNIKTDRKENGGVHMHLPTSKRYYNPKSYTKLPSLSSINMDTVRMTIAPPFVLDYNSKKNLENRLHILTFAELSFKLDRETESDVYF